MFVVAGWHVLYPAYWTNTLYSRYCTFCFRFSFTGNEKEKENCNEITDNEAELCLLIVTIHDCGFFFLRHVEMLKCTVYDFAFFFYSATVIMMLFLTDCNCFTIALVLTSCLGSGAAGWLCKVFFRLQEAVQLHGQNRVNFPSGILRGFFVVVFFLKKWHPQISRSVVYLLFFPGLQQIIKQ